ncbi:tRNA (adenosine(37)-N6)-threonylcarbamoyltransferase complex dimerization subunit type 1 TsaB [Magnetococcus sp. PR-3]|uniref:tRNA (adenosine(37)-N6)-threonylcarbamoyltransferase complex dimerization subunit type 1 TsaB n=1 Tax=Magnetococcus sp. PR-3 TaxID=3120355 RepID=UPI002FCE6328
MKVLALDTTTSRTEIALAQDGETVAHFWAETGTRCSGVLHEMLKNQLAGAGWSLNQLDLLVGMKGPGAFTGLRIGLAAIKTFARVLQVPAIGLGSLELLASRAGKQIDKPTVLTSAINVFRDEVYYQHYQWQGDQATPTGDIVLSDLQKVWVASQDHPMILRRLKQRHRITLPPLDQVDLLPMLLTEHLVLEALDVATAKFAQDPSSACASSLNPLYIKPESTTQMPKKGAPK